MIQRGKRRAVQIVSLLLYHSAFAPWMQAKWLCTPVLSCHACALAWTACPIGVFIHYAGWQLFPFLAVGTLLLVGAAVGRLFCGWVCPFGTLQALLYRIPSPKIKMPGWTRWIKYAVLALTVFLLPFVFGESTYLSFCRICPAAALQVVVPSWWTSGFSWSGLATLRFSFLALFVVLAVLSSRSFCKLFCPIGAFMAPLNHLSFWKIRMPHGKCPQCRQCDSVCSTDVKPSERMAADIAPNRHQDCIVCHDCQKVCPVQANGSARR